MMEHGGQWIQWEKNLLNNMGEAWERHINIGSTTKNTWKKSK